MFSEFVLKLSSSRDRQVTCLDFGHHDGDERVLVARRSPRPRRFRPRPSIGCSAVPYAIFSTQQPITARRVHASIRSQNSSQMTRRPADTNDRREGEVGSDTARPVHGRARADFAQVRVVRRLSLVVVVMVGCVPRFVVVRAGRGRWLRFSRKVCCRFMRFSVQTVLVLRAS